MDHYINKKTEWNLAQFPAGMDKYCPDILRAIVSCRVNHHDKLEQFGILRNAVKNNCCQASRVKRGNFCNRSSFK